MMHQQDRKILSAGKTLEQLGYTWEGGELWKPPLGASPEPLLVLIDTLRAKIEALEKDEARLNHLEKTHQNNVIHLGNTWYSRKSAGMPHSKHSSLRAAIDAAIAGETT